MEHRRLPSGSLKPITAPTDDFGSLALDPFLNAPNQSSSGVRIPVMAIDDAFTLKALRVIKIDVEGMEIDVLRGAEQTIRRLRPILYIKNEWPDPSEPMLRSVRLGT